MEVFKGVNINALKGRVQLKNRINTCIYAIIKSTRALILKLTKLIRAKRFVLLAIQSKHRIKKLKR